ncbi:MAG: bacteriohemerythrin [Alphaproteobacteria bacterium]|jgi:hemerythrin-like metal-binding protein|nr:bacteriohemerythrin [Alphaproteobacteria bacterium]
MLLEWSDELSVGVSEIDEDHKKLLEIVNRFFDAYRFADSRATVLSALTNIADYASWHFDHEERIMRREKFPGLDIHKRQHSELLDRLAGLIAGFETGRADITEATLGFLSDWVLVHLKTQDLELGRWVLARRPAAAV